MTASETSPAVIEEPTFVLQQIPGCWGGALGEFLYESFAVLHDEPDAQTFGQDTSVPVLPIDVGNLSAAHAFLYRGHWRYGSVFVEKLYPEFFAARRRFFTAIFLGHPLWAQATTYLQLASQGRELPPFDRYLRGSRNTICGYLGISEEKQIREVLGRYDFVGLAGPDLAESLKRLAQAVIERWKAAGESANARRAVYFLENWLSRTREPASAPEAGELVKSAGLLARAAFRMRNRLDYQLYDFARGRL